MVKNLEIQKLEKDKIDQAYSECDYQISIQKKIAYIAEDALINDILPSVLTVILYKILTPEYVILNKADHEKNQIFSRKANYAEKTIRAMHIITKQCNGAQSFILCAKPDSRPGLPDYSPGYQFSTIDWKGHTTCGQFTFLPEDYEIKQSAIHETLKSLIESGFSF